MTQKIAIIGECMVEFQKAEANLFTQNFGGDTLNTAVYLRRLLPKQQYEVAYLTGVGKDTFSQQMLSNWQQEQLDTSFCFVVENKNPGIYTINLDSKGERTFNYWRNDAAAKYWIEQFGNEQQQVAKLTEILSQFDYVYLSGISIAILPETSLNSLISAIKQVKQNSSLQVIFDNNYRKILWKDQATAQQAYRQILQVTDYAFLTFDDEQALWGVTQEAETIASTKAFGVKEIVIKRGKEPCLVIDAQQQTYEIPAKPVSKVVDTTAAGDSFSAGYLSQRIQQHSVEQSATKAHAVAAEVIQHKGAIIPLSLMQNLID